MLSGGMSVLLLAGLAACVAVTCILAMRLRSSGDALLRGRSAAAETRLEDNPLFKAIPDLVWQKDTSGRYLHCNSRFADFVGLEVQQIIGCCDRQLFGQEKARAWRRIERSTMDSGRASAVEEWVRAEGGRQALLLAIKRSPVYDAGGRLTGILAIGRDISERYQVESSLRQKEAYQRALLDNFPFLVWLKDRDSRFLAANQAFADAIGFADPESLVGKQDLDVWPPDIARRYRREDRQVMARRAPRDAEEPLEIKGRRQWIETYKAPVLDASGRLLGTVGFSRDISERRLSLERLRESEARFRLFFEGHGAIMLMVDPESGHIVDANRAAFAFYGFPGRDLIGKTMDDITAEVTDDTQARCNRVVEEGHLHFELDHRLADGAVTPVEVYASSLVRDGRPLVLAVMHDISARSQAQAELEHARRLLEEAQAMAGVGSWELDLVEDRASLSPQACAIFECDHAASSTDYAGLLAHVHPGDRERVDEAYRRTLSQRTPYGIDHRLEMPDGRIKHVHVECETRFDSDGAPRRSVGTIHDITELKETQLELDRERQRLADILAGTDVGTWEWNVQTGETRFNERWASIIGLTLNELEPVSIRTWLDKVHTDDQAVSEAALERHFRGEAPFYEVEVRMRHKGGHWVWILDRGRVIKRCPDGSPLWMYGVHMDITQRKLSEIRLRASEERMRVAASLGREVVYERRVDNGALTWFGAIGDLLGLAPTTFDDWVARIHADEREQVRDALLRAGETGEHLETAYRLRDGDGVWRTLLDISAKAAEDERHVSTRIGICRDVTAYHQDEERVRLNARWFDQSPQAVLITDAAGVIVDVNQAFSAMTGYSRAEAIGRNPSFMASGRHDRAFFGQMWKILAETGHWHGEMWNRRGNGRLHTENLSVNAVRDDSGRVTHYIAVYTDTSALKAQQKELERAAYFDALTQLPNRVLLTDRMRQAMARGQRHGRPIAVACLDLDSFKEINDRFGHSTGDRVLLDVATRIRQTLREEDTLARIGGDEFAIILADLADQDASNEVLRRLLQVARKTIDIDGQAIAVTASIGATLYPQADEVDPDQLLRQADHAMYQAKTSGKDRYHLFDHSRDRHVRGQMEIVDGIRAAIAASELQLHYQPKVNMRSGEIIGAEALVRWPLQHGGMRMPAEFLPFIENGPVISELDDWVIRTALAQLDDWRRQGKEFSISVNLSAVHLQQPDFVSGLRGLLESFPQVDPGRLVLEILETTALMDLSRISAVIRAGHEIGVSFALDDFGTGYSSLTYLKNLPASQIKIDRSFVRDMLDDRDDLSILEGIMGLARAFNRIPVAEGVESVEHGELLLMLGCELAQGFGIGRPMPADEFQTWCEQWRPDPIWRDCRALGCDDLQMAFAIVEHRAWMKALKSQANGGRLPPPALDPQACKLGRWLDEHGRRIVDAEALAAMVGTHEEILRLAPLVVHRDDESPALLERRLARLQNASERLVRDLQRQLRGACSRPPTRIGASGEPAAGRRQPA
jgi:diguanylate cyclase (GGDEF)-like protein/PAS domain S-box-containing protein